jgi:hypothetical protein
VTIFRASRAIVIGIDDYRHGIPPLRTARLDAMRVGDELRRHGYEPVDRLCHDVTLAAIRSLLAGIAAPEANARERLIFYFAGHGVVLDGDDGPEGYLVPEDATRDDRTTFLPMRELQASLAQLGYHHLLVVVDCCFAGSFRWSSTRDVMAAPAILYKERFARYSDARAWQAIASSSHRQRALDVLAGAVVGAREGEDAHSPFAAALLEGLAGAADLYPPARPGRPAGDGVITVSELFAFVRERVAARTARADHAQTPMFWPLRDHEDGEFFFLAPGRVPELEDAPPLTERNNPYRGLQPYDVEDADIFSGRREATDALCERVLAHPLTVVTGPSGSGKSSLVRAGLVPALRRAGWTVPAPLRPGQGDLSAWVRRAEEIRSQAALVVDQLEELFTLPFDAEARGAFLDALARLACQSGRRLVLAVRSDYEGQFRSGPLGPGWEVARFSVPLPSQDDYREMICAPAATRALFFDPPELVDELINDVVQMPGGLPLLSFALSEMVRSYLARRADDRCLARRDHDAVGGVVASLRQRVEHLYSEELSCDRARRALRRVMLRMVSLEGGELARRRVPRTELVYSFDSDTRAAADVVSRLESARLVVADRDADGRRVVEPAHDALIHGWGRLLEWTSEAQEELALRRLLTAAVTDWKARRGGLWSANPRLPVLARLARLEGSWLNRDERRFVRASVRRRSWLQFGVAIALLALTGLGGLAYLLRQEADQASRERTREAGERARKEEEARTARMVNANRTFTEYFETGDLEQGFFYLVRALREDPRNTFARSRLIALLTQRPRAEPAWETRFEGGTLASFALAPDGQHVVCLGAEGKLSSHDAKGARTLDAGPVLAMSFTTDGKSVVALTSEEVRRWNVASGTMDHAAPVLGGKTLSIRPDARLAAVAAGDAVVLVPLAANEPRPPAIVLGRAVVDARFLGEGDHLVVRDEEAVTTWTSGGAATREPYASAEVSLLEVGGSQWCRVASDPGGLEEEPYSEVACRTTFGEDETRRFDSTGVRDLAVSADGRTVAVTTTRDEVHVWALERDAPGDVVVRVPGVRASLSADAALLSAWNVDGTSPTLATLRSFDARTGRQIAMPGRAEGTVGKVAVSADGLHHAAWVGDNRVTVWEIAPRSVGDLARFDGIVPDSLIASVSDDGRRLLRRGDGAGSWEVLDPATSAVTARVEQPLSEEDEVRSDALAESVGIAPVSTAVLSRDGRFVITAAGSEAPKVWSAADGSALCTLGERSDHDFARAHHVSGPPQRVLLEYQVIGSTSRFSAEAHIVHYRSFDLDGCQASTEMERLDRGESLFDLSPDGSSLLLGRGRSVYVRGLADPTLRTPRLELGGEVAAGRFSRDGLVFAATARDGSARLADAATGLPVTETLILDPAPPASNGPPWEDDYLRYQLSAPPRFDARRVILWRAVVGGEPIPFVLDVSFDLDADATTRLVDFALAYYGLREDDGKLAATTTPPRSALRETFRADLVAKSDLARLLAWLSADVSNRRPTPLGD